MTTRTHPPFDEFDRTLHASVGQFTRGMSLAALGLAFADWAIHFWTQPSRASQHLMSPWTHMFQPQASQPAAPLDRRLQQPEWAAWPASRLRDAWLAWANGIQDMFSDVPGVERHHGELAGLAVRQWLLMTSPANHPLLNPAVQKSAFSTMGRSLAQGALNWTGDLGRRLLRSPLPGADEFRPGAAVATTPGKVVLRNRLIELIQYAPATPSVHPEPVLVVSAWIMKYYVLDLSPHNSLIRYLVDQGHTVFAISWRNPQAEDRDLGIEDYLQLGVMAALDAIGAIVPRQRVHAVGYCLGGTLMALAAAAMARDQDERLATLTLLAAQTDFSEPGELGLFIDESQLSFLDCLMSRQGYLDATQMAGAFALLRPVDLIWAPFVHNYLMGERAPLTDLLAWNADGTRMPWRMHADYLRNLFLNNALAQGQFRVHGAPVSLRDVEVPIFAVGTLTDHVAPWRSVYKINLLCDGDITFALTDGGHNAGIVSEPSHAGRHFRIAHRSANAPYVPPDRFLSEVQAQEGSWWPALHDWLAAHSGARRKPPRTGAPARGYAPLDEAPGRYVHQR